MITFGGLYGGVLGGGTGWLLGEALEGSEDGHTGEAVVPGALAGSLVGASAGALVALTAEWSNESQALLYTSSGHGTFYGVQIARLLVPPGADNRDERIVAAGLAGSMLGLGTGILMSDRASSPGSQGRFSLATGVGWLTATGVNDLAGLRLGEDGQTRAGITLGTSALFGAFGVLGNRGTAPGPAATSLSIAHGAWAGAWSPLLFTDRPEAREVTGGLRLGLGVGYGSSLVMAGLGEPSSTSVGLQVAGWAAGSALGAGLPLAAGGEGPMRRVVAPMLIGGLGGQVAGAALAPHFEITPNDSLLLGTLGTWTTYQAIGWGTYAALVTDDVSRPFGYALTVAGTGTLLTLTAAPALEVEPAGSMMLLSSGGWGTWYGAFASQLGDRSPETRWLTTLGSGNGVMLACGIAQAAGWRPAWRDVALIDGLGLVGAATGGLVGVVALYDADNADPMVISTLAGSTVGLVGGFALTAANPAPRRTDAVGLRKGPARWQPSLSAAPLPGADDGPPGGIVTFQLNEVRVSGG